MKWTIYYEINGHRLDYKLGGQHLREFLRRISRLGYPLLQIIDGNGFDVTCVGHKYYDYLAW